MLKAIKETNGDLLGVPLFILLIIYFFTLNNKKWYEWALGATCCIALIVDSTIVIKYFKVHLKR